MFPLDLSLTTYVHFLNLHIHEIPELGSEWVPHLPLIAEQLFTVDESIDFANVTFYSPKIKQQQNTWLFDVIADIGLILVAQKLGLQRITKILHKFHPPNLDIKCFQASEILCWAIAQHCHL